jgi:dipeptidyl aminopeptidase/acylaminoacyl peptidase
MRLALSAIVVAVIAGCTGAPKPPPCNDCQPWTPGPIPRPPTSASASAPVSATPPPAAPIYTIEQLLKVRRSNAPRAIDDASFVYLYDAPGTAQLHAPASKEGEAPRQITTFAERVSNYRVSPDGKEAVLLKDQGGDENDQIYRIDLGGQHPIAVTARPKVKHTMPAFERAGKRIAFTSNGRNGKDMDLYVQDWPGVSENPEKPNKPLVELAGNYAVTDFHGDRVLLVEARSNVDHDVWIIDQKTKQKKLLTKHTGDERYEAARFSRDGKAVYVLTDAGREFTTLVAIDIASGKRTEVVAEDHDLMALAMPRWSGPAKKADPDDLAMFVVNLDGIEKVALVTLDGNRKIVKRSSPNIEGVVGTIDIAPSGKAAFVAAEGSTHPTEVYRVDLTSLEVSRKTVSDHAGVEESKLIDHQLLTYKTFDGKQISYLAWIPKTTDKLSAVIEIHGGPEAQAQPWFSGVRQYLALAGYAVVAPNVRGSLGYGKSFSHLDDKERREDSVRDIAELGKVLGLRPDIDPTRIALYGGSYGGYMVLAGLTLYPDLWAAGVDIVGIANFKTFLEQTAPYRRALREAEYGSLEKDAVLLDKISPIHKVDKIRAPLMVIHGTNDPRVPVGEAKQIATALEKRKVPVQLMTFDDEGHGLAKLKNRLVAYPAMVKFLDQYVRNRK